MLAIQHIPLGAVALLNLLLAAALYLTDRHNPVNTSFAAFTFFVALWASSIAAFRLLPIGVPALYAIKTSYVAALLIAASYYVFSCVFPNGQQHLMSTLRRVLPPTIILSLMLLVPGFLTHDLIQQPWGKETTLGMLEYLLFAAVFLAYLVRGLMNNWREYRRAEGILRTQLLYISLSVTVAGTFGILFNLLLPSPFFQDFRFIWLGPLFTTVIVVAVSYAIGRYRLFETHLLAAELLVVSLLVGNLLSASTDSSWLQSVNLTLSVVIAYFLIRSVQRELAIAEEREETLRILSHQERVPISQVRGALSILKDSSWSKLSADEKHFLSGAIEAADEMRQITDDILTSATMAAGRWSIPTSELVVVDLATTAGEAVRAHQELANQKGLSLELEVDAEQESLTVLSQPVRLRQMLDILISNAIKYTERGSVRVHLQVKDERACVTVSDTGIGIPADSQGRVFGKLFRAENAKHVSTEGTGLGLFILNNLVNAHPGARITFASAEDKGTSFSLDFARVAQPLEPQGHTVTRD